MRAREREAIKIAEAKESVNQQTVGCVKVGTQQYGTVPPLWGGGPQSRTTAWPSLTDTVFLCLLLKFCRTVGILKKNTQHRGSELSGLLQLNHLYVKVGFWEEGVPICRQFPCLFTLLRYQTLESSVDIAIYMGHLGEQVDKNAPSPI